MFQWEEENQAIVDKVTKGMNPFAEHYSALKAEVPFTGKPELGIDGDPATQTNMKFINTLRDADIILFSGQALSHCVRYTIEDVIEELGVENAKNIFLLEDGSSCVESPDVDFKQLTDEFLHDVTKKGLTVTNTVDFWKM